MNAIGLLHKILDYRYLWSLPQRVNSKPAIIRLAQIECLLEAFDLSGKKPVGLEKIKNAITGQKKGANLQYFEKGLFLYDRPQELNKAVLDKALAKISSFYEKVPSYVVSKPNDVLWLFNNLFHFRQDIFNISQPNGGMEEGFSVGLYYSFHLQAELKQIINDNVGEIDDTLWQLMDPERRSINENEIENYPQVNLEQMDLDWRMDNY